MLKQIGMQTYKCDVYIRRTVHVVTWNSVDNHVGVCISMCNHKWYLKLVATSSGAQRPLTKGVWSHIWQKQCWQETGL